MTQRLLICAILALGGIALASHAQALGFGRLPESLVFGQALDLSVPLRLEPGDAASPGCLQAEVHVGDQRIPPSALSLAVERRAWARDDVRLRLRSSVAVQEPLVAVNLSVGCQGAVARQFVVFADPPNSSTDSSRAARAELSPLAPAPVLSAMQSTSPTTGSAAPQRPAPAGRRTADKTERNAPDKSAPAKGSSKVAVRRNPPETPTPRLKLEEPEERLRAAIQVVASQDAALASAAQAANAAQAAASAAEQTVAVMDSKLQAMRDEAAASRLVAEQLRQRLAQADGQGRWQSALAAFVVALAALALWQALKLRALRRERQTAWWQAAARAGAAAEAAAASVSETAAEPAATPALPAAVAENPPLLAEQRTAVPLPKLSADESLLRPVSVDELIDLEQQADFFLVLGEEEAAVDLLMSYLRSSGGASPLPYLKLLELYRSRQDNTAYERLRMRFGQRFNGVAPPWEADPDQGRELQDYPSVLQVLQACWGEPLDAMAELEGLLFRKRSGEIFELPAYRDVLTLYAVARDLHRQDDQEPADVDVLLPLALDGGTRTSPTPSIFDKLDAGDTDERRAAEDKPTAPVDLDLSELAPPPDSRAGELRVTLN